MSKNVSDKMPPEATRLVPMERMSVVLDAREVIVMRTGSQCFWVLFNNVFGCT